MSVCTLDTIEPWNSLSWKKPSRSSIAITWRLLFLGSIAVLVGPRLKSHNTRVLLLGWAVVCLTEVSIFTVPLENCKTDSPVQSYAGKSVNQEVTPGKI